MSLTGIDTIAIVVSDRHAALEWYRDVLGLPVVLLGPEDPARAASTENLGHWIEMGWPRPATRIHLCESSNAKFEAGPTGVTLISDSIVEDYERLSERGVAFVNAPRLMEWGEWLCMFMDPDGNTFDLKQRGR